MIVLLSFLSILVVICYYVFIKPHNYWNDRDVQFEKPTFLIGNWGPVFLLEYSNIILYKKFYDKYLNKPYIALYQFLTPVLLIKDPELIKQITIKDFDSFSEHANFISTEDDPLWSKSLLIMPGDQEWKDVRSVLSPAFTKNKLQIMFNLMVTCTQQFINNFEQEEFTTFEAKHAFSRVTNDIIATAAFGVECNSMKNPENEFFLAGQDILNVNGFFFKLKFFLAFLSPFLSKLFKVRIISEKNTKFFKDIIVNTIRIREEQGIIRPDMIHLMMEARKGKLKSEYTDITSEKAEKESNSSRSKPSVLTDDIVAAQALIFYIGGFDTISTSLSFIAYELAINPDIQLKLYEEISDSLIECNGAITYEAILNMKYLDMVVSESLRKWPPFGGTDRKTVKPFTIKSEKEKPLSIDENVICVIPIYALHRDELYWHDPEKFDPERFNDENKAKIKPFTYMPFGVGPRSCIANRFALLAIKSVIVHLLHKFEIVTVGKTKIPLQLSVNLPDLNTADDYWLGLNPRK